MRRILVPMACPFLFSCCGAAQAAAPELPAGPAIEYEDAFPAQPGFDRPLFVAFHASDAANAYVVTQPGRVFVVPRDGSKPDRRVFLDLAGKVYLENWEEGLLGFAFDPRYADNGFVYAYWTERTEETEGVMAGGKKAKSNRRSVISRFATKDDGGARVADAAS